MTNQRTAVPSPTVVRVAVIANPVASQFTGGGHRDVMSTLSSRHDAEAIWPGTPGEAEEAAAEAASNGVDIVVAMGGDGMVHHVSQGLVRTGSALGIVPVGTTNVIARLLGIPSKPGKAARLIADTPPPRSLGVATMTLNRGTVETTHHAIFACGVGLDAEVVSRADTDPYKKYRFGSVHYARTAVGVALGKSSAVRKPHVGIRIGEETTEASTALVQFRDVYTYFGKIPLHFGEETPDPMSVLTFDRIRRSRVPQIAFDALMQRNLNAIKGARVWERVDRVEFKADPPVAAQADGEGLGLVDSGVIEWSPGVLTVIAG